MTYLIYMHYYLSPRSGLLRVHVSAPIKLHVWNQNLSPENEAEQNFNLEIMDEKCERKFCDFSF